MTSSKQAYDYVLKMVNEADTYFAFKCVDNCIAHFGVCFTELKAMKSELIDARCDKWRDVFSKPNIQIKNQNNDHASTT